jgi:hypothetical protein
MSGLEAQPNKTAQLQNSRAVPTSFDFMFATTCLTVMPNLKTAFESCPLHPVRGEPVIKPRRQKGAGFRIAPNFAGEALPESVKVSRTAFTKIGLLNSETVGCDGHHSGLPRDGAVSGFIATDGGINVTIIIDALLAGAWSTRRRPARFE